MIHQETGDEEFHFDDQTPMDWSQDLDTEDFSCQPADRPESSQEQGQPKGTSSYGKSSCVLPVTFFDIQSNILLLNECNPLSISVVDCNKHPWYYKRYIRTNPPEKDLDESAKHDIVENNNQEGSMKISDQNTSICIDLTDARTADILLKPIKANKIVLGTMESGTIKPHKVSKNGINFEQTKQTACSQVNLSKIDLKHNKGLIGLRVVPKIETNNNLTSFHTSESLPKLDNKVVDECFSTASKVLGRLGTIIVPLSNSQDHCNILDKKPPKKTNKFKETQSSMQITQSKPRPKFAKKSRVSSKITSIPVLHKSEKSTIPKDKLTHYCKRLDEKPFKKEFDEMSEKPNNDQTTIDDKNLPFNNEESLCVPKHKQDESESNASAKDVTFRSSSPIFPCNSKQKTQTDEQEYLIHKQQIRDESKNKVLPSKPTDMASSANKITVQNWPKSNHEFHHTLHLNVLQDNDNKSVCTNINNNSQETSVLKNNEENNNNNTSKSLNEPVRVDSDQIDNMKTRPMQALNSIEYIPKSSNKGKDITTLNVQKSQKPGIYDIKNTTPTYVTDITANDVKIKNRNSNMNTGNNSIDIMKQRERALFALFQQSYLQNYNNTLHVQKNPGINSKPTRPRKRPPVQTVTTRMCLPIQTHKSKRPETNMEIPGIIPSGVQPQNIGANLFKQSIPSAPPTRCKVNDNMSYNYAHQHNFTGTTNYRHPLNTANTNMFYSGWNHNLAYPLKMFMHPPTFVPPPPPLVPPPPPSGPLPPLPVRPPEPMSVPSPVPTSIPPPALPVVPMSSFTPPVPPDAPPSVSPTIQTSKPSPAQLSMPPPTPPPRPPPLPPLSKNDTKIRNIKILAKPKIAPNLKNVKITEEIENTARSNSALQSNGQNMSAQEESMKNEKSMNCPNHQDQKLSPSNVTNKTPLPKKSTIMSDKPNQNIINQDTCHKPNNITKIRGITIRPVAKPYGKPNHTTISSSPINHCPQRYEKVDKMKGTNSTSSPLNSNDVSNVNKSNMKSKPGPLCMKNGTGRFGASKTVIYPAQIKLPPQTSRSQPNKGYSPPILPIPTFQTILAQTLELQASLLKAPKNRKPGNGQHMYTPTQNITPNANPHDKGSRKRLHFGKNDKEGKKVKKISLEDYKNRNSGVMATPVDLTNEPGTQERKYPRKSENSWRSLKSLSDVVNLEYEL